MSLLTESPSPLKLVYPDISSGISDYSQVLLIDNAIQEPSVMANAVNSTTFPITYSWGSSKAELIALLREKFVTIDRIAIAFSCQQGKPQPFLDGQVFFTETEISPYSENVAFIISLIQEFQVKQIDYLGCSTLKYAIWNQYYSILKETGVTVGASTDQTGNIKYGGNWTLESTGQDIEQIYFTQGIQYYQYVLDAYYSSIMYTTNRGNYDYLSICSTLYNGIVYFNTITYIATFNVASGTIINSNVYNLSFLNGLTTSYGRFDLIIYNSFIYFFLLNSGINAGTSSTIYKINLDDTSIQNGGAGTYEVIATVNYAVQRLIQRGIYLYCVGRYAHTTSISLITRINLIDKSTSEVLDGNNATNEILAIDINSAGNTMYILYSGSSYVSVNSNLYVYDITGFNARFISNTFLSRTFPTAGAGPYNPTIKTYYNYIYITTDEGGTGTYTLYKYSLIDGKLIETLGTFTNRIHKIEIEKSKMYFFTERLVGKVFIYTLDDIVCFKEDSLILTDQGYKPVQELRKGDLVRTELNGYIPVDMIGQREIYHPASDERIKDQLYECSPENYPELFEPLVITGCHSILVDEYVDEAQLLKSIDVNGNLYMTGEKYRLPACVDERTTVYNKPGSHTIYHFALENENYYENYGVYANGLLVETCSKRYLKELSHMELIE